MYTIEIQYLNLERGLKLIPTRATKLTLNLDFDPEIIPVAYTRGELLQLLSKIKTLGIDKMIKQDGVTVRQALDVSKNIDYSSITNLLNLNQPSILDNAKAEYDKKFRKIAKNEGLITALYWAKEKGNQILQDAEKMEKNIAYLVSVTTK